MALTKITSRILDSSGVTILGTIATGVWQGTPIADDHIASAATWNTASTDRLKWDCGATGLTASTGRTSLGLVIGTDVLAQRTFNDTNWDNAYTYSQVGHLPLAGGTLTGALVGTSATFNTGANRGLVLDNDSVDTGYNIVSLNGTNVKGSYSGIAGGGTNDNNLYLNSANGVIVQTGSSFTPKLTILTCGNVGIGTTSPSEAIEVKGNDKRI